MDRKTIIILAACMLLMLAWQPLTRIIWPPIPLPPESTNALPAEVWGQATQVRLIAGPDGDRLVMEPLKS